MMNVLSCFQDPETTPPPTRGETRDEKTERKVPFLSAYFIGSFEVYIELPFDNLPCSTVHKSP